MSSNTTAGRNKGLKHTKCDIIFYFLMNKKVLISLQPWVENLTVHVFIYFNILL